MTAVDPKKERNVGVTGHGGVGKTTLIEHLLHDAGVTKRLGTVEEGNTVCDYLDEEIESKHTIILKLCHMEWHGDRIYFIDHPGYADFVGELAATAPLLDGMVILVDATTGIQAGTDNAWKYAEKYRVPRAFFVNKLDRDHTDFFKIVSELQETYGKQCVPLVIPIGQGEGLTGVANIFDGDTSVLKGDIDRIKEAMTDAVAETDDRLMEKYLETGVLSPEEFHQGLHDGITAGKIMPIIAGSAAKFLGVDELLDVVADSFPSPLDRHVIVYNGSQEGIELKVSRDEPFVGQVFRSIVDPYVGQLTLFKVLTGTLKSDTEFYNVSAGVKERTGKIFLLNGKEQQSIDEVGPGDIAAMTKLKNTRFGDTIAAPGVSHALPRIELPEGMVRFAIHAKSKGDEDKLGEALHRLADDDPTFRHYRDEETGQHIIQGLGDVHLNTLVERMKRRYKVETETSTPRVRYREAIRGTAEVQGRHKKQTGGHGQYGDVQIRVKSRERGAGYEFVDSIVGGVVPRQYIPHIDKGCQDALARGVISGHPVIDVCVELFYGSYHNVDSSEMAFKIAASIAIRKAIQEANPCILEPIMEIAIAVPDEFMGDITGDLNSRRGRIIGMDAAGPGRQVIRAHVPESEILRYSPDLRSMTHGRGAYEIRFSHYDEAPHNVSQQLITDYEKRRAEGEG
ncbi:MAG: elongation factor G [Candidatus Hydrogenedentes bacterium]|nr:elongation factor G [Candidatus Hydrogenedentota bacterium]